MLLLHRKFHICFLPRQLMNVYILSFFRISVFSLGKLSFQHLFAVRKEKNGSALNLNGKTVSTVGGRGE